MSAVRALILVVLLLGLVGVLVVTRSGDKDTTATDGDDQSVVRTGEPSESGEWHLEPCARRPLPGENPEEEPEFETKVVVDQDSGKNQIKLTITETHGYFVETLRVNLWYRDSRYYAVETFIDDYISAGSPLEWTVPVTPAEMDEIGIEDQNLGSAEDWEVEIVNYNRWRTEDPNHPAWPPK
jgi:hypothetical protein